MNERKMFFVVASVFIIGAFLGMTVEQNTTISYPTDSFSEKQIILAAVDDNGNGVAIPLQVEVKRGDGKVLTDIDKLLFWIDTQYSIQVARDVASNITDIDTSTFDLIYTIDINQTGVVAGPSAGGALTIATIAALLDKPVKQDIIITGTINEDGTIGKVGGILEKAKAAKDIGAEMFLVPKGQAVEFNLIPEQECKDFFGFIYCETRYQKQVIDIGESAGIEVKEVENINEALNYFFE